MSRHLDFKIASRPATGKVETVQEHLKGRGERLAQLTQTSATTSMGRLLRRFWQPVALSKDLPAGRTQALTVLGEDLTLYRGTSGRAFLVGGRCAHRLTQLNTGWIEGDQIRCMYHGWRYDGSGACTERPAELDIEAPRVAIAGYPTEEYAGLIFAFLGVGPAPAFELPRKAAFERPGSIMLVRKQIWDCNWFQMVENSLDAVHVSFVHAYGRAGTFIEAVTQAIPELEYAETDAGIRQIATRGVGNVRISDWTFPNNNHISQPGLAKADPWIDTGVWMVPVDDKRTARLNIYAAPSSTPEAEERLRAYFASASTYNAAEHYEDLFHQRRMPDDVLLDLTNAQDYIAQRGQGEIVDRSREVLGRSDAGIALLRRIFLRELDVLEGGAPTKTWRPLAQPAELPVQRVAAPN